MGWGGGRDDGPVSFGDHVYRVHVLVCLFADEGDAICVLQAT